MPDFAAMGIAVTALFVAGVAERRDRTLWRMDRDSIASCAPTLVGLFCFTCGAANHE